MRIASAEQQLYVFPTELGWFGILGSGTTLARLTIGQGTADAARAALFPEAEDDVGQNSTQPAREADWQPQLREALVHYARGERVDFTKIRLALPRLTDFQQRIVEATRRVPYGGTISYGELAAKAGYPRAARAVGSVMKANRFPILVPCHRVIAAAGKIGGYSAPQGIDLKQTLLRMEAETCAGQGRIRTPNPKGR